MALTAKAQKAVEDAAVARHRERVCDRCGKSPNTCGTSGIRDCQLLVFSDEAIDRAVALLKTWRIADAAN